MEKPRTFEASPAVRERVPLLIGLVGPSGSGKTYSALRLATGIQSVVGGDIYFCDSEARRALHYADQFKFLHVPFGAPFGPLDYLAMLEFCVSKGAKTIVVDSLSHEHEGPGGVLEMHETETERLVAKWKTSYEKAQMSAWALPKSQRRRLINSITQMNVNFIFCFRAKEKLHIPAGGGAPKNMGWMPIAGEEYISEMTANCLLLPRASGVPEWHPKEMGEQAIIKLPERIPVFVEAFKAKAPLSEDIGAKLAAWAAGSKSQPPPAHSSPGARPVGPSSAGGGTIPPAGEAEEGSPRASDAQAPNPSSQPGITPQLVDDIVAAAKAKDFSQKFVRECLVEWFNVDGGGRVGDVLRRLTQEQGEAALGMIEKTKQTEATP